MKRSALRIGLGVAVIVLAWGCATPPIDDPQTDAVAEPLMWNGCPNPSPVTTANLAPPHAFPGPCYGPGDPGQAAYDGALAELEYQCATYCGQSMPECAAAAHLGPLTCMDRDIGHRWGALCVCG